VAELIRIRMLTQAAGFKPSISGAKPARKILSMVSRNCITFRPCCVGVIPTFLCFGETLIRSRFVKKAEFAKNVPKPTKQRHFCLTAQILPKARCYFAVTVYRGGLLGFAHQNPGCSVAAGSAARQKNSTLDNCS